LADIFLSYSREDIDRVRPLVLALEKDGFSVWWDGTISPGEKFEETIDREIQVASSVLVVWSAVSVDSQWVKNEALEGMDRDVLVPVMIDSVRLPVAFKQHQAADFTRRPDSIEQDQYQGLVDKLHQLVRGERRDATPVMGIADRATRGRQRYRRKRDIVVPMLVGIVLLLTAVLFISNQGAESTNAKTRLTIDRFEFDAEQQSVFYADSITRELQVNFADVADLELVQIGSLWDLNLLDVPEGVTKTQADYILGGSVAVVGDDLQVNAHLRDAPTGRLVWQTQINEKTSNLLEIQRDIQKSVLANLNVGTSDQNIAASLAPATLNKQAYRDYLIGQDLLRSGEDQNLREAIGRFESAYSRDENFMLAVASTCRAYIELFRATKAAEDFTAGKQRCKQVLASDQSSAEMRLALAELYLASGETNSAKLEYLETLKLSPGNPDASIGLASVLVAQGDLQGGEELYLKSVRQHPTYWKAQNSLGAYYFRQGMYHRAIESWTRVTELTASSAAAFSNLGAARLFAGNFEDALLALRRSIELDSNSGALANLGSTLYYLGRFEEALQYYKAAIEIDTSDHRLWGNLGDNLRFLEGRDEEATQAYTESVRLAEAIIEINPDDAYTLSRLAVYYAAINRVTLANEVIKRAEILAEFDLNVLYDFAVASVLLGDNEAAQEYVSRALYAGYPAVLIKSDPQLISSKVK